MHESKGLTCICSKCYSVFAIGRNLDDRDKNTKPTELEFEGGCASDPCYEAVVYCPYCEHRHLLEDR